ncbi:2'-5' RNA ligase family protein [Streptomyces shenzhenensis]
MRAFFRTDRIWPGGGPYPHVLVPLEQYREVRGFTRAHLSVLARYRDHLGIVPENWVHATVQGFCQPASAAQMQQFTGAVRHVLRDTEPFTIQIGPTCVGPSGVLAAIYPESDMDLLSQHVRAAAESTGFEMRPADRRFWPHAALAYGQTARWDSDDLARDLLRLRPERVEITVDRVHLVSQYQHPDAGFYTWEVLEELPLGRAV